MAYTYNYIPGYAVLNLPRRRQYMPNTTRVAAKSAVKDVHYDEALRKFFNHVFLTMSIGLFLTAMVSELIANTSLMHVFYNVDENGAPQLSTTWFVAAGLELVLVFMISSPKRTAKAGLSSMLLFFLFAALTGITTAPVLYAYTAASAGTVFLITAGTFGSAALWGYTTKMDMSRFSGFLVMGLIGLILAMVVNIFLGSPAIQFAISIIGVGLFVGLTAWDMQTFRRLFDQLGGGSSTGLVANATLALYLDFLNLFLFFLELFGVRK